MKMFMAALFVVTSKWKQPKETIVYTLNKILYRRDNEQSILLHAVVGKNITSIMLNE